MYLKVLGFGQAEICPKGLIDCLVDHRALRLAYIRVYLYPHDLRLVDNRGDPGAHLNDPARHVDPRACLDLLTPKSHR